MTENEPQEYQMRMVLDPETREQLEQLAQAQDRSMSGVVRQLIREAYAELVKVSNP